MLELRHISKSFPGVRALEDVSLQFRPGEIHGLVGENGAGKSTAIKIIAGILAPDAGDIVLNGAPITLDDARDSLGQGIGIVHQELQVIPDASVAENIMLDKLPTRGLGVIDWPATFREARKHVAQVGLDVPLDRLVRGLSAAQKQLIQIARALSADVKVLLLDEPTSSLTEHEARRLFALLRELRARGVALVFVSHKLGEIFELCDRVSVLRDGRVVGCREIPQTTPQELVHMMIGRECNDDRLGRLSPDWNTEVLRVEHVVRRDRADDISFALHRGEILGFYGLVGSGRTELARILIGEDAMDSGSVLVRGRIAAIRDVGQSLYEHGIGYVTENRKEEGLLLEDSVQTNLAITVWPKLRRALTRRIDSRAETALASRQVDSLRIKTTGLSQPVKNLSGGNQQKVSIGKWLAADCDILIIDEPTAGVDVGAKQQIHQLIGDLAARDRKSVILISSDLPEIVRLANRILIFREHRIVGEVRDVDTQNKRYAEVSAEIAPHLE
ncbi:MAG TPA: sugar ABC transporter ATP-binding protein [Verrucomicrobiae bacterium]|nr:sugar ABC transporter ATP-binding protein [Verrucomicrobiae bacterium]